MNTCRSCGCSEDTVGPLDTEAFCKACAQARRDEARKAAGWKGPGTLSPTFQGLQARAEEVNKNFPPGGVAEALGIPLPPWADRRPLAEKGKVCPVISRPHDLVYCIKGACEAWREAPRTVGARGWCVICWGVDS